MLATGFNDTVAETQAVFRDVMQALARPATPRAFRPRLRPPRPLKVEVAAIALALADQDTPIWLDEPLSREAAVIDYLRFQTGALITTERQDAVFALVVEPAALPDLGSFAIGTSAYPDRSCTIIAAVRGFSGKEGWLARGPGIENRLRFKADGLAPGFIDQWERNRQRFPQGVDLLLAAEGLIAGLPRTTDLAKEA